MITTHAAKLLLLHLRLVSPPLDDAAASDVRAALDRYVDELRDTRWTVDQVIVAIKTVAADAGIRPSFPVPATDAELTPNERFLVDLVRWSVEHYVGAPSLIVDDARRQRQRA